MIEKLIDKINKAKEVHGFKRIAVHERFVNEDKLKSLGFKKSLIAVPERGQSQFTTWRGPYGLHCHKHNKYWVFHKDKHDPKTFLDTIKHVFGEGLFAMFGYLNDDRDMLGMVMNKKAAEIRIPSPLPSGSLADKIRRRIKPKLL